MAGLADNGWFIKTDEDVLGPVNSSELQGYVRDGLVKADTLVRTVHSQDFVQARFIKGLLPIAESGSGPIPQRAAPTAVLPAGSSTTVLPPSPRFANSGSAAGRFMPSVTGHSSAVSPSPATSASAARGSSPALPDAAYLLEAPPWKRLWPLAVIALGLGWIIGGCCGDDRMYLPGSLLPVLVLALGGVPCALAAMIYYLRPYRVPMGSMIATGLFTGTIGVVLLLSLQFVAAVYAHGHHHIYGRAGIFQLIMMLIGTAYDWTNSDSIGVRWMGFVFGVGVCEETTKLLPLVMLIKWGSDRKMSVHTFLLLGFTSGLGFGIAEALYAYAPWSGNYGVSSNLIRWYSAIPSHAIYSTICAAFLWRMAQDLADSASFWEGVAVVAKAVGIIAVLHGTYDTVCTLGVFPSLLMAVASFVLMAWAVTWITQEATEPPRQQASTWVEQLSTAKMSVGVGASALLLIFAMSLGTSAEKALPAIALANVPAEYQPYVTGVTISTTAAGGPLTGPLAMKFTLDLAELDISGSFTNTTDSDLKNLLIVSDDTEHNQHGRVQIPTLAVKATTVIDSEKGWSFTPHEHLVISADGIAPIEVVLP